MNIKVTYTDGTIVELEGVKIYDLHWVLGQTGAMKGMTSPWIPNADDVDALYAQEHNGRLRPGVPQEAIG